MLFINYKGNIPQQRFFSIGVQDNNKANKICFVVDAVQDGLDLSEFASYIKVQDKDHKYLDKCEPDEIIYQENRLELIWELKRKTTEYRNIEVQLQFESADDVVWQSLICELELNGTIRVDEEISDKYPTAIQDLERTVHTFDDRLDAVEHDKEILSKLEMSYDESDDATYITFPNNVAPLVYYNSGTAVDYYFNYEDEIILDGNDGEEVGQIVDRGEKIIIRIDGELEPNLSDDDITFIYFNNWVGINAWNLYHAQPNSTDVINRMEITSNQFGTHFRFPSGVLPIRFETAMNCFYFDYQRMIALDSQGRPLDEEVIEFDEQTNQLSLDITDQYDTDRSAMSVQYMMIDNPSYNQLVGNTYKMTTDEIVLKREGVGSSIIYTFPKGIIPITFHISNRTWDSTFFASYSEGRLLDTGGVRNEYLRIGVNEDTNQVYLEITDQKAVITDTPRFTYIKTDKDYLDGEIFDMVCNFDFDCFRGAMTKRGSADQNIYRPTTFTNGKLRIVDYYASACVKGTNNFITTGMYPLGSLIYFNTRDYVVVVNSKGSLTDNEFVSLYVANTSLNVNGFNSLLDLPIYIPKYLFFNQTTLDTFIATIENAGGSVNTYDWGSPIPKELGIPQMSLFYADNMRSVVPLTTLTIKGTWKYYLDFGQAGAIIFTSNKFINATVDNVNLSDFVLMAQNEPYKVFTDGANVVLWVSGNLTQLNANCMNYNGSSTYTITYSKSELEAITITKLD